jgi:hypothetical protein
MVNLTKGDVGNFLENKVEEFLKENDIKYQKNVQVIGKFKPDFLLKNNIMLEVKFVDDSKSKQIDPPHERNMLSHATFRNQLIQRIYPEKNFKNIMIIKRKSGRYSPTNTLFGNMIFDLFLPFEYLDYLKGFLAGEQKEEIFFKILDELFNKNWKKERSTFPSVVYHFMLCLENNKYIKVSEFIKSEKYKLSNQLQIYNYLRPLELLKIIKREKLGRDSSVFITNPKWRYFVYLVVLSKGQFTTIDLDYAKDLWDRIEKEFNI